MKAVILAGGLGSRLSEETQQKPKPMVEIGGKPILLHIMDIYAAHGIKDFIICGGYKCDVIKEYFLNLPYHMSDIEIKTLENHVELLTNVDRDWNIKIIDTGLSTMTGGRLKRIEKYVSDDPYFYMTYGDGVSDVDISAMTDFHNTHNNSATVMAVRPIGRFGALEFGESGVVERFNEKPRGDGSYINGGFFILKPSVLDLIKSDTTVWEQEPLETLSKEKKLVAYEHNSFWHPMDTLRDKMYLESLFVDGRPQWVKDV